MSEQDKHNEIIKKLKSCAGEFKPNWEQGNFKYFIYYDEDAYEWRIDEVRVQPLNVCFKDYQVALRALEDMRDELDNII